MCTPSAAYLKFRGHKNSLASAVQWQAHDIISQPTEPVTVFDTLTRIGAESVSYRKGDHVIIDHVGKNLSIYRDSLYKLKQQQTMLGAVLSFHMPKGGSFTAAKVTVSREPEEVFGRQVFEFGIHKLSPVDAKQFEDESKKAKEAVPSHFLVTVAGVQDNTPTVRPRPLHPSTVVSVPAKSSLCQTTVRLQHHNGKVKGTSK